MGATHAVVEWTLKPDGSLEVTKKLRLPPGRVRVTVEVLNEPAATEEDWFAYLERARADREASGAKFLAREMIDAEIDAPTS